MTYFNKQNDDIELSFSTLSFYDEMVGHHDKEMQSLYADMLPFSADGMTYNTGLFTSRPNLKVAIRTGSRILHAANKLFVSKVIGQAKFQEQADAYLATS